MKRCLDRRKKETRSGSAACKTSTCKYFENLIFLQDKIANRDTVSNIKLDLGPSANSLLTEEHLTFSEEIEVTPPLNKRKALDDITDESSYNNKRPVSRSRRAGDQVDTMLIKALKDLDKPSTEELPKSKDAESDSDTLFCQSLISTLKSLGPKENMKAKMQIQQLLFTLKFPDCME